MIKQYLGGKFRKTKPSERAEAVPAAIITAIVSSLLLLGIASTISLVVQSKAEAEGSVQLTTIASNIDVSMRSDVANSSFITASAKLKQPTGRLLTPTDISLSGVSMHIPVSNTTECKLVRWSVSDTTVTRELKIYSSTKNDGVVKCDETSAVKAERNKVFADSIKVAEERFAFYNQVGRELTFNHTNTSLTTVNNSLDSKLKAKNVSKLNDTDFNALNTLLKPESFEVAFADSEACAMNAGKVAGVCPTPETPTIAAAWNSTKIGKVGVGFEINQNGEVAKRDIEQNSSIPLYRDGEEAAAAVAGSTTENRPKAPKAAISTTTIVLGTNYTVSWETLGVCPVGMTPSYNLYENGKVVYNGTALSFTKAHTNSADEYVEYTAEALCSRGAMTVVSVKSNVVKAKVIPATPALVISKQPAATNAPLNSAIGSAATCLYGTTARYNVIQTAATYGTAGKVAANLASANVAINSNGFTVVQGAQYQYKVEAWCESAFDKSTVTDKSTNSFITVINAPTTNPAFTAPAANATGVAVNAAVKWSAAKCAVGTTVQYYTTKNVEAGASIAAQVMRNWTGDLTVTSANTEGNTVGYDLKARCAGTANVNSSESPTATLQYTTLIKAPAVPKFSAPAANATGVATNAALKWAVAKCATGTTTKYYLTKNIDKGAAITNGPVLLNWAPDLTATSSNTEGNIVGYTLAARCDGPNAISTVSANAALQYTTVIKAPAVPKFTAPAANAKNVAVNANVTWGAVTCAAGTTVKYYAYKSSDKNVAITDGAILRNWTPDLSAATSNTQGNTVGYKVSARCEGPNVTSAQANSAELKYTTVINAPAVPVFTAPAANAKGVSVNTTVTWNAVTCAADTTAKYYMSKTVDKNVAITDGAILRNWTTNLNAVTSNTQGNTVGYTLLARCDGPNANSAQAKSAVLKYTTAINAPAAPKFTAPAANATDVAINATVTWGAVTCAADTTVRYYMSKTVDKGAAITGGAVLRNWTADLNAVTSNTQGNTVGYVVSARCDGPNANSAQANSAVLKYTTAINAPAAPKFTAPAANAKNVATNATVTWGAVTCPTGTTTKYYMSKTVDEGVATDGPVLRNWLTNLNAVTSNTQGNTVGYVVSARCDGANAVSSQANSAVLKYTTVISAPAVPAFTSPAEGATGVSVNTAVKWGAVTCATGTTTKYRLIKNIDKGATMATPSTVVNFTTAVTYTSSNTQGNTVGYTLAARCDGPNANSAVTATDTLKYTTAINAPAIPKFTSPAANATGVSIGAAVNWGAVTCATGTTTKYYMVNSMESGTALAKPVVLVNWTTALTATQVRNQGSTYGYFVSARCDGPNADSAIVKSTELKFTTTVFAPDAPKFTSPTANATGQATNVAVKWDSVTCPIGTTANYYVTKNIEGGKSITAEVIRNWTTHLSLTSASNEGSTVGYTVRARCEGPNGNSANSPISSLKYTTKITAPATPTYTAPAANATGQATNATVRWSAVTCGTGTKAQYYFAKQTNGGASVNEVLIDWGTATSAATSNLQGYTVGYRVTARCVGDNVTSANSARGILNYTTKVNAPGAVTSIWNNGWSWVDWNAPSTGCAAEAPIKYRLVQTKADNSAGNVAAAWQTGGGKELPNYNTGGYPQWAEVETFCDGYNADSTITSTGATTKWVKNFDVNFSTEMQWRRLNVGATCPFATDVNTLQLYVAADGWNGQRFDQGIQTDQGHWIAAAGAGPGGNSGWVALNSNQNDQWIHHTHSWGYWGQSGWGARYTINNRTPSMVGTYWNASAWGNFAYWWYGNCSTQFMSVSAKGSYWQGGGIRNVGNPNARYDGQPNGRSLTTAGNNAIK